MANQNEQHVRSREDHISWQESGAHREERNKMLDGEDHIGSGSILLSDAVDLGPYVEHLRVRD